MCREDMIAEIMDMVRGADDRMLESCYWFLIMEMDN